MGLLQGDGLPHTIGKVAFRSLQFILGLTVAGIYGNYIRNQRAHNQPSDSAFVFAVVTGGLSCITALVYIIPKVKAYYAFIWDWILTIFWIAVFGRFAALFLNRDPNNAAQTFEGTDTQQMKNTVWIDLISCSLWVITAIYGTWVFLRRRRATRDVELGSSPAPLEMAQEKPHMAKYVSRRNSPVSPLRPEEMRGSLGTPPSLSIPSPPEPRWSMRPEMAYIRS